MCFWEPEVKGKNGNNNVLKIPENPCSIYLFYLSFVKTWKLGSVWFSVLWSKSLFQVFLFVLVCTNYVPIFFVHKGALEKNTISNHGLDNLELDCVKTWIVACFMCVQPATTTRQNAPEGSAWFSTSHLAEVWSPNKCIITGTCYPYWNNMILESHFIKLSPFTCKVE